MDQRREPRLDVSGPARVTILGDARREISGRAVNISRSGLRLILKEPVPAGTLLMVEWEDSEVLGEICYCQEHGEGYAVGLEIEHALVGTRELARLARRLMGDPEPEPAIVPDRTA